MSGGGGGVAVGAARRVPHLVLPGAPVGLHDDPLEVGDDLPKVLDKVVHDREVEVRVRLLAFGVGRANGVDHVRLELHRHEAVFIGLATLGDGHDDDLAVRVIKR